jgi:hypothetical protein
MNTTIILAAIAALTVGLSIVGGHQALAYWGGGYGGGYGYNGFGCHHHWWNDGGYNSNQQQQQSTTVIINNNNNGGSGYNP